MKKIILTHITLWILSAVLFFVLGSIDKKRLDAASAAHHPELIFAHERLIVEDGGSIYWESLMYRAHEERRMRVWKVEGETKIGDGFQGTWWTWKYHNLVWIYLIIGGSLLGSTITCCRRNVVEQVASSDR